MYRESRTSVIVLAALGAILLVLSSVLLLQMLIGGNASQQTAQRILQEQYDAFGGQPNSVLQIPSIQLELPILWEYSEDNLKNSICRYQGVDPGEEGDLVITGHDYLSGAHFGSLDQVAVGDEITVYDKTGFPFTYTVYELLIVEPDDIAALKSGDVGHTLTLMTCADNANRRLLIRCRMGNLTTLPLLT